MKIKSFMILALAGLLLNTSCSQDKDLGGTLSGREPNQGGSTQLRQKPQVGSRNVKAGDSDILSRGCG